MKKQNNIKVKLLIVVILFIFCKVLFANTNSLDVTIPDQLAVVGDVYKSPTNSKTIIHIQDAHCNYEAQKKLSDILEYLVQKNNLKLIMVEGGSGDVSLNKLREAADIDARVEIAEKYLKSGEISGEEYLNIVSDYDIELFGIEDKDLYEANLNSYLDVEPKREKALKQLQEFENVFGKLKEILYPREMKNIELAKQDYENKKTKILEYIKILKDSARNLRIDLRKYSNFYAFSESAQLERLIDVKKSEEERNQYVKDIGVQLEQTQLQDLINKTQDLKKGKVSSVEYYLYLKDLSKDRIDLPTKYPQLDSYIYYLSTTKNLDSTKISQEVLQVETDLMNKLASTQELKTIVKVSSNLNLLKKFIALEITPEEYVSFLKNKNDFIFAQWVNDLTQAAARNNLNFSAISSSDVDENIDVFNKFYEVGIKREESFVKNISNRLESCSDKYVVLITGGFHTPGISELLKKRGFSYLVVTPLINSSADSSRYFSVLREKKFSEKEN